MKVFPVILRVLLGFICLFVLYLLSLVFFGLIASSGRQYDKSSGFYKFLVFSMTWFVMRFMRIRIIKRGFEKLPEGERFLLVCNHRSSYDPIVKMYSFRKYDVAFIAKKELFDIPIIGGYMRRCLFMDIDRENPQNAVFTIDRASELIKRGTASVAVYPEGTRSKSGKLLDFHNSVFKIAQKAECPIVVCALRGTEKIKFNPFKHNRVYLDVIETIPFSEIESERTNKIGERVRADIESVLENGENGINQAAR